ncbi:efflux RND transporter permease subunit [Novipirellula artificiosorum]|uniref:Efflux pump membrane transporter BepG n=1 Tax=Novipirellula artificiosorum TaxID=2528016 RepID=A0A5C6D1X2_9BACT|nr:efflux RND transporter permease subunit [Novipirellula artificiosorum]TWU30830.1 Efflux pump membrane transporter BepG [Novipirellula artificiosorum]
MNLAAFAIKYRPIVITITLLLLLWGVISVLTMPRREDPQYTVRTCVVTSVWPGAPAEQVEKLVTKPLEEAIDSIDEVDVVYSETNVGISTIYVDAEDSVTSEQIDNVWNKVRARVQRVEMPDAAIVPDVNDEFGDTNVIVFCVYQQPLEGEQTIREERRYTLRELDVISEHIKDELRLLPGVAKSAEFGVRQEAIYVETDIATWSQLNLTTTQLQQLVESRNIVASGGSIDTDVGRFSVKPGGELDAVEELDSIVGGKAGISEDGSDGRPVYLRDLGMKIVREYEDPPKLICRYSDANTTQPAVVVAMTMKAGSNIVTICDAAKQRVREMQTVEQSVPADIAITPISDQSQNVSKKISDVVSNVIGAILIVVVVVYLIVGFRSAAVMASNIPVVVLGAIALVTLFGVELEQISLASLIIALGLLVDNAVQVCDQARTNQIAGMNPESAAVKGSSQVASPMLMGTATTIAAFAPMLLALQGSTREYVYSLPVTLSITLALSWVLAMTFCTILAAAFIRAPKDPNKPSAPLPWLMSLLSRRNKRGNATGAESDLGDKLFRSSVKAAIDYKFVTVGVAIALFALSLMLPVGSEFFPQDLRDQFAIEVWLPENVAIEKTDQAAKQVETILRKLSPSVDAEGNKTDKIRAIRSMVGGGGSRWYLGWAPESRKPNYAEILVRTTDATDTPELVRRLREIAEKGDTSLDLKPVVGARVVPQELLMGPSGDPVELRVFGPGFADIKTLRRFADQVKEMIRNYPGTWDVSDSWGVSGYQLRVNVDEDAANLAGISNSGIARTLNAYYSGHHLTTFREGDHLVPVFLRLPSAMRGDLEQLPTAPVEGTYGKIPLNAFADVDVRWEPAQIRRRDLNRVIEVRCQVEPGVRGNDVVNAIMASDEMRQLINEMPPGFRVEAGGNLENSQDGAAQLSAALGISLLAIILLLVIQYNGWSKPLIILATLPLALIGALPGLYITGNALGFMPQLGILSLFGIVLNTGIIFMEFADILILKAAEESDGTGPICGLTVSEFRGCLVDACRQRLLPIFLTTATTIGGLLPLAMAGGPLWEGMAWCMIFGLMVATLLTLLVVPSLYSILVEHFGVKPVKLSQT